MALRAQTSPILAQQYLVSQFAMLTDWQMRYQYIIELGKDLPEFPRELQIDANLVRGCQSQVWLCAAFSNDQLSFTVTSDAAIVRGLIAILLYIYHHRSPNEILSSPVSFIAELGLESHLSMARSNGLRAMLDRIYAIAAQYKAVAG